MLHSRQLIRRRSPERVVFRPKPETLITSDGAPHKESRPLSPDSGSKTEFRPCSSRPRVSAARALSTEFQSLKLESMSPGEENGGACTTKISPSAPAQDVVISKHHYLHCDGDSLHEECDEFDSLTSSSDDEKDVTQRMFKEQTNFFCQMKDFLLSQQTSLRRQLEVLNSHLTSKKKRPTHVKRPHRLLPSSSSLNIPMPEKAEIRSQTENPGNIQQFFSCSSTDKSDYFQMCPICGLELEISSNPEALEDHVAGHWCSKDSI